MQQMRAKFILFVTLSLKLWLFSTISLAADSDADTHVKGAFKHPNSKKIILLTQTSEKTQYPDRSPKTKTIVTERFYWGDLEKGFFELPILHEKELANEKGYQAKQLSIFSPSSQSSKTVDFTLKYRTEQTEDGMFIKDGSIKVTCEGHSTCLMSSQNQLHALGVEISRDPQLLMQLPEYRRIDYIYGFVDDPSRFIILESGFPHNNAPTYMVLRGDLTGQNKYGKPDKIEFLNINGRPKVLDKKVELKLDERRTLTLVVDPKSRSVSKLVEAHGWTNTEDRLVQLYTYQAPDAERLASVMTQLELPPERYKAPNWPTACEILAPQAKRKKPR